MGQGCKDYYMDASEPILFIYSFAPTNNEWLNQFFWFLRSGAYDLFLQKHFMGGSVN